MPDRRSYGRTTPRSRSPPHRGRPTDDYVPGRGSRDLRKRGNSQSDASDHGRSYGYDGYCGDRRVGLSSPHLRHRRCNPVDDGGVMPIGRSVGDSGRYDHGEQYSPQRRRLFEERGYVSGVAEDSRDGYRHGEHKKYDEFGRIIGVDDHDAVRARPVEGRPDGRPYAPPPWQYARVPAENAVQGIAEDLRDGWRGGYRNGKIGSFEFRRTDDIDRTGRVMPIGRWSDGEHGKYGPWESYSPSSQQLIRVQVMNDMRGVTEDFQKDWRHGHPRTRRQRDEEIRKGLDVNGESDERDCYRGDRNVMMAQKNESICSQYGELASGKVQRAYLLQKRERNVDPGRRVGLNDCSSWSPGNSYKLSDGRGHKGEEVLNNDYGLQTSISMVTDESLRNFPGFLDSSSRETYKHSVIDYGHADPYGTSGRGKSLLEGMPSQMGLSTEGELPLAFSVSQSKMMYSPPRAQVDVIRDRAPVNSHSVDTSHQNVSHEAYAFSPRLNSSRLNYIGSNENLHGVSKHYMEQGSKRDDFSKMPDNLYDKVRERYGLQNRPCSCVGLTLFNGIDEMDHRENLAESQQLDRRGYEIGPSYVRVEDRPLGLRDDCPDYSKETFMRSDHLHSGTGEGYEGDYGPCSCQDGLGNEILTKHDQAAPEDEWPFHAKHAAEEMDATSQYDETRLKRWHGGNVKRGRRELKEEFFDNQANNKKFPAAMYEDKHWTVENNHVGSKFRHSMVESAHEKGTNKRIPVHLRLDFRKHRDVRKRLGPPLRITKFSEATDLTDDDDGADAKIEPSEDLEAFKQLVNTHFLRFFKFLNETSAQRRKYSNHDGSGTFRCRVCGSTSKEFGDIKALVMHTFMCQAVGLRSQHLGFHKALCVLIGWDSSYLPDTPWVPRQLSEAATSNLKEGLIIWPPVVVIHNSSLEKPTSDERILISIEHLEEILKGWGCGNWKKSITRGKPANNSILLVIYKATFSGLLEAKKLGRLLSDKGRGKVDLENMVSGGGGLQVGVIGENAGSVLYGYLGIAEDLENLDFETKKRCVIRSEKEIQNIMDECP